MEYDVSREPWLPVLMQDGSHQKLSLADVFSEAHHIEGFDGLNPMESFSIHRFLVLFLMDAYRPESLDDILELLDKQVFDDDVIKAYFQLCQNEGVSFDLFDTRRPFMQAPYDASYDTTSHLKPVAVLDYTLPSGNNPVHFVHQFEADSVLNPDQTFIELLTNLIFCTSGLQGPSGVYGAPPLFFVPQGKNLFETLVLSMQPLSEADLADDAEKTLWRNTRKVIPKQVIARTSFWYGMFFPSRRVLLQEENGKVRHIYYQAGLNFEGYESWRDPYVLYIRNKKGVRTSLKPSLDKEIWRNIGTLMFDFSLAPAILQQLVEILEEYPKKTIPIMTYGAVTNQAAYEGVQQGVLKLDVRIANDYYKRMYICKAVKQAELDASILRESLQNLFPDVSEIPQYIHRFYTLCEDYFYKLSDAVAIAKNKDGCLSSLQEWSQFLRKTAGQLYDEFGDVFCRKAEDLLKKEEGKKFFYGKLKKNAEWSEPNDA